MIAIISHDAGGAEILSSWIRQNKEPYCLVLSGPAISIFKQKLGIIEIYSLADAIEMSDWILCGTSWQSDLEKQAIFQAKAVGKKVIAYLDHWVNYLKRFKLSNQTVLPDEIWVGDLDAKNIAQKIFLNTKVLLVPNPYFKDLQAEIRSIKSSRNHSEFYSILYVCEPIREHGFLTYGNEYYWGYTEENALQFFLENINALGAPVDKIKIRPHPSENQNKYNWAKQECSLIEEVGSPKSLIEEILEADVVVGCQSMAMVLGLLAKKRVISSIPPGGKACELPQVEIEHLQDLIKKYRETFNAL